MRQTASVYQNQLWILYFAVFSCIFVGLILIAVQPDCTDHFSLFSIFLFLFCKTILWGFQILHNATISCAPDSHATYIWEAYKFHIRLH